MNDLHPVVFVSYFLDREEEICPNLKHHQEHDRPIQKMMNSIKRFDAEAIMTDLTARFSKEGALAGMNFVLQQYATLERSTRTDGVEEKYQFRRLAAFVLFLVTANKEYDFFELRDSIWDATVTARFVFPNLEFWRLLGKWLPPQELVRRSLPLAVDDDTELRRFAMSVIYFSSCEKELVREAIRDAMISETNPSKLERYKKLQFRFGRFNLFLRRWLLPSLHPYDDVVESMMKPKGDLRID